MKTLQEINEKIYEIYKSYPNVNIPCHLEREILGIIVALHWVGGNADGGMESILRPLREATEEGWGEIKGKLCSNCGKFKELSSTGYVPTDGVFEKAFEVLTCKCEEQP